MNRKMVARELTRMAREVAAVHSPEAQEVIQALRPVKGAVVKLRKAIKDQGDDREADGVYLDLTKMIDEMVRELKKH